MANNMEMGGARPKKETLSGVIFNNRFFSGLWTNRNPLRVPTGIIYEKFYHIGDDALFDGLNTEISNHLTLIRRPGCPQFSPVVLPAAPDTFSSFHELNGTIKVLADTSTNVYIMGLQSSVTTAQITSNVATYTTAAAHGYTVGQLVTVTGCTSSFFNVSGQTITSVPSPTTFTIALTHSNFGPESETGALAGTLQSILTKSTGAGQGFFQGVNQTLYIVDGVDTRKWQDLGTGVLGNNNNNATNPTWAMGIAAPATAPVVTPLSTGASSTAWQASTFFSTMGLIVDSNSNIEQLVSVNSNPAVPNTTNFGTSGNGQPAWNNAPGGATTDNTVTWQCSATAMTLWTANTTYAHAAIIFDPKTNGVFYMSHTNSQTSGTNYPNFNTSQLNQSTDDGSARWRYLGSTPSLPLLWQPSHVYSQFPPDDANPITSNEYVVEPIQPTAQAIKNGQLIYVQFVTTAGTSGTFSAPNWGTTVGSTLTGDNQLAWTMLGPSAWAASTPYSAWSVTQNTFGVVLDSVGNFQVCIVSGSSAATEPFPYWLPSHVYALNFQIIDSGGFIQKVTTNGTSGAGPGAPTWNETPAGTTTDGGVTWTNQGAAPAGVFAWGSTYGAQTKDGTVTWVNVGPSANSAWKVTSIYYLPSSGFFPPIGQASFGSAAIKDSNGNIEYVISSGFSGNTTPSWAASAPGQTTDNAGGGTDVGVTWINNGLPSSLSFTYTQGYGYGYAFKSRLATDPYTVGSAANATVLPPGVTSLDGTSPRTQLPVATGSGSGVVSNMSPTTTFKGSNSSGAVIKISGIGSLDPQVDTIEIFRTTDGGASYFYLTDIPNPPPGSNGTAGSWTLFDATPDLQLNLQILGPLATVGLNSQPPAGLVNLIYFSGRLWGSVGNIVYASAGPDVGNPGQSPGNGFESWPSANQFPFSSQVTRLVPINQGILVFTTSDLQIIGGGPSIAAYTSALLAPGYGLLSWNELAQNGGQIFFYSADKRLLSFDPAGSISEVGYPVGDQLSANFPPAVGYLAWHVNGSNDQALYIADGSTSWYRGNTSLSPDQGITGGVCWSPKATVNGGSFKAIASVETAPGIRQLLVGQTSSGKVMQRDSTFTTFADLGSAYAASAVIGGVVLCNPGQMAELDFITCEFIQTGTSPKLLVRLDEISGSFEDLSGYVSAATGVPPQDPPLLYGLLTTPTSIWANRYYFAQTVGGVTPLPTAARFMFIKIDYGSSDTVMNEALTLTIFGKHYQES